MSFDGLFRRDWPNKTLQGTAAGMAVSCQSQRALIEKLKFTVPLKVTH
jgi:hypothetical protein